MDPRRETIKLSPADLNLLNNLQTKNQNTLKLKMCFVSTEYLKTFAQNNNQKSG